MNKCVFFDRDGIVNMRLVGAYISNSSQFKLLYGFTELLKYVQSQDYLTILITNQQGVGKGLMTDDDLTDIHNFMQSEIKKSGVNPFDDIYYCSQLAKNNPWRRKPNPGMFEEAIIKWDIDVTKSYMIGDMETDAISAKKVNLATILINSDVNKCDSADYIFNSYSDAKQVIENI